MNGFFLINKPKGITSHDVVFKLKKKFNLKKVGHTGTLDPFASGLLVLCIGKATKLASLFQDKDKTYEGTILFNNHYDTYDTTGTIVESKDVAIDEQKLNIEVEKMIKTYQQLPPMYAAIKVGGKKLYEFAREGIEIEREKREVTIYDFKTTSPLKENAVDFYVHVSKGTYVRSIAVDLAEKLNTYGALAELKRTSVGSYHLKDAKTLELVEPEDLISLETYLKSYPSIKLNAYMVNLVKNGIYLDERQTTLNSDFVVLDEENQMVAFYQQVSKNNYKPALIL